MLSCVSDLLRLTFGLSTARFELCSLGEVGGVGTRKNGEEREFIQ